MKKAGVEIKDIEQSSDMQIDDDVVVELQRVSENLTYESPQIQVNVKATNIK